MSWPMCFSHQTTFDVPSLYQLVVVVVVRLMYHISLLFISSVSLEHSRVLFFKSVIMAFRWLYIHFRYYEGQGIFFLTTHQCQVTDVFLVLMVLLSQSLDMGEISQQTSWLSCTSPMRTVTVNKDNFASVFCLHLSVWWLFILDIWDMLF